MERKQSPLPVILRVPFALAGPLRDSCFKFFCLHNGPNFLLLFRFREGPLYTPPAQFRESPVFHFLTRFRESLFLFWIRLLLTSFPSFDLGNSPSVALLRDCTHYYYV